MVMVGVVATVLMAVGVVTFVTVTLLAAVLADTVLTSVVAVTMEMSEEAILPEEQY